MLSFALATTAALILCLFDANTEHVAAYAIILCLAKSGVTLSFGFAYAIHQELFPNYFIVTSYGVTNFFCRGLTIFSPIVAEIPIHIVPLLACVGGSLMGLFAASQLVKKKPEGDLQLKPAPVPAPPSETHEGSSKK